MTELRYHGFVQTLERLWSTVGQRNINTVSSLVSGRYTQPKELPHDLVPFGKS